MFFPTYSLSKVTTHKIGWTCVKIWSHTLADFFFEPTIYIGSRVAHCSAPGVESPVKWDTSF